MTPPLKRVPWHSAITEVAGDRLVTHGVDQREIIRDFTYEEMVFFLLKGVRPNPVQRDLLRAILVAHISHGITGQSTLAVMEAADLQIRFPSRIDRRLLCWCGHLSSGWPPCNYGRA